MIVKAHRSLKDGHYSVQFEASEFTEDEKQRFVTFGVPTVELITGNPATFGLRTQAVAVTELMKFPWSFPTPEEAQSYETRVLDEIRTKMQSLRLQQDSFTSSKEIAL